MKTIPVELRYPVALRPGDQRFFESGLVLGPYSGTIAVRFPVSDVRVDSPYRTEDNIVRVSGNPKRPTEVGLCFGVSSDCKPGSRKEFGLYVYQIKVAWARVFVYLTVLLVTLGVSYEAVTKSLSFGATITIGTAVSVTLSGVFVLGTVALTYKFLPDLFFRLEDKGVTTTRPKGAYGGQMVVRVIDSNSEPPADDDRFVATISIS